MASILSACGGWHLRGRGPGKIHFKTAFIKSANARKVSDALRQELYLRGVQVTTIRKNADVILELSGERFDRRVLSVDSKTGKVREIELGLQTYFAVRERNGKLLIPNSELSWQLDYVFDEDSLLATNEQANVVRRDLAETAATTLVLRLQAVRPSAAE